MSMVVYEDVRECGWEWGGGDKDYISGPFLLWVEGKDLKKKVNIKIFLLLGKKSQHKY